jgi:hypothetical protein
MIQTISHTSVSAAVSDAVYHMDTHTYENADALPIHDVSSSHTDTHTDYLRLMDTHTYECNQCRFGVTINTNTDSAVLSVRS